MNQPNLARRILGIALFSAVFALSSQAQDAATRIDDYLAGKAKTQVFSGSVIVTKDGQTILRKGYGFANVEHGVLNTPGTKFRIGSMIKQFTAMAIMMLQEQGKLTVKDTIGQHLRDIPASWQPITIHQLLTHTSGLIHSWELPGFEKTMMVQSSLEQVIARYKDQPLLSKPGEKFHYSGLGYFLLAEIIEKVSGKPYGTFLRQQIFDPLEMNDTGEDRPGPILAHRASGYVKNGQELENAANIYMPLLTGGGNLYSTVDDLSKWDQALKAGRGPGETGYRRTIGTVSGSHPQCGPRRFSRER